MMSVVSRGINCIKGPAATIFAKKISVETNRKGSNIPITLVFGTIGAFQAWGLREIYKSDRKYTDMALERAELLSDL